MIEITANEITLALELIKSVEKRMTALHEKSHQTLKTAEEWKNPTNGTQDPWTGKKKGKRAPWGSKSRGGKSIAQSTAPQASTLS